MVSNFMDILILLLSGEEKGSERGESRKRN